VLWAWSIEGEHLLLRARCQLFESRLSIEAKLFPHIFNGRRASGLAIRKTLFYRLPHIDHVHQIIPRRILRHLIY